MIIFYILSVIISAFLVKRYAVKSPIVLHKALIILYCFYNPFTNKVIFIIIAIWCIYLLFQKKYSYNSKYVLLVFTIGTFWLYSGMRGILNSKTMDSDDIASFVVSPYVNGVLWSVLILVTIKAFDDVIKFVFFYALLRMIEVGITGIVFYFLLYDTLMQYGILLKEFIRLDVDPDKRLISIASRNANDAAFLLISPGILYFQTLYHKVKLKYSVYFAITSLALILTWTRSGWIIFFACIVFFFLFLGKIKLNFIKLTIPAIIIVLIFGVAYFMLSNSESRLTSDESILIRFQQYSDYFNALSQVPLLNGIYEDIWTTCDYLNISRYITSENIFLETFIKHGIIAGILYSTIWAFFLILNIKIVILLRRNIHKLKTENLYFIAAFSAVFFGLFLMANTSLFEQSSFYWLLFALSVPIYNYLKQLKIQ